MSYGALPGAPRGLATKTPPMINGGAASRNDSDKLDEAASELQFKIATEPH
jgi:hypothetical protein